MDVEIRTVAGSWLARVDVREIEREPGAAAQQIRRRIQRGEAVAVTPLDGEADVSTLGRTSMRPAIFNPGHVVAVVEYPRGSRSR